MKLLADENLPPRLVQDLTDLFSGSVHVISAGLGSTSDDVVWNYAKSHESGPLRMVLAQRQGEWRQLQLQIEEADALIAVGQRI